MYKIFIIIIVIMIVLNIFIFIIFKEQIEDFYYDFKYQIFEKSGTRDKNCKAYFDGCNTCYYREDGMRDLCTEMACLPPNDKEKPKCEIYW